MTNAYDEHLQAVALAQQENDILTGLSQQFSEHCQTLAGQAQALSQQAETTVGAVVQAVGESPRGHTGVSTLGAAAEIGSEVTKIVATIAEMTGESERILARCSAITDNLRELEGLF